MNTWFINVFNVNPVFITLLKGEGHVEVMFWVTEQAILAYNMYKPSVNKVYLFIYLICWGWYKAISSSLHELKDKQSWETQTNKYVGKYPYLLLK